MQAIFKFDGIQIPIEFDLDDLVVQQEYILLGGETDEEFQSRRNTLSRWLLGLPKVRKTPIGRFVARMQVTELPIKVKIMDLNIFKEWMYRDIFNIKSDCKIYTKNKTYTFFGSFPSEWTDDGNIKLAYDCYQQND